MTRRKTDDAMHATLTKYIAESLTISAAETIRPDSAIDPAMRAECEALMGKFFDDTALDSLSSSGILSNTTPQPQTGTLTIDGIKTAIGELTYTPHDPTHIPLPPLWRPPAFYGEIKWVNSPGAPFWLGSAMPEPDSWMATALRRTAIHEAGHAVVAHHYGATVSKIMVSPFEGEVSHSPLSDYERDPLTGLPVLAIITAAGSAAESHMLGEAPQWRDGSDSDKEKTWAAINKISCAWEGDADPALARAHQLLGEPGLWRAVELLADELTSTPLRVVDEPREILWEVFARIENRLAAEGLPPIRRINHFAINLTMV